MKEIQKGLGHLNHFLNASNYAYGDSLTTADGSLAPFLFFIDFGGSYFGYTELMESYPKVHRYWQAIDNDPTLKTIIGEMRASMAATLQH